MEKDQDIEINIPHAQPQPQPEAESGSEEDVLLPLTGKPRFDLILGKSNVKQCTWFIPARLKELLPPNDVDVVFFYRGKQWPTSCKHQTQGRRAIKMKEFVTDNNLHVGDACVFEVIENTTQKVTMSVHILRGDFPAQLMDKADGARPDKPVMIDL